MGLVVHVSDAHDYLAADLSSYDVRFIYWPQEGRFGDDAANALESTAAGIAHDLADIDCVVCEFVTSAPVAFLLRQLGYSGPIIWIPYYTAFPYDKYVHGALMSAIMGPSDTTICLSPSAAIVFEKVFGLRTVCIAAPGIDYDVFRPLADSQSLRSALDLPNGDLMIYAGRCSPDKNIASLLSAYSIVRQSKPDASLVLCFNDLPNQYFGALEFPESGVVIRRDLGAAELAKYYSTADLFVSAATSIFENLGLAPLEAIACGTAVAIPAWNGFRDYYLPQNGLLAPVAPIQRAYDGSSYVAVDDAALASACAELLSRKEGTRTTRSEQVEIGFVKKQVNRVVDDSLRRGGQADRDAVRSPIFCGLDSTRLLNDHFGCHIASEAFLQSMRPDLHQTRWPEPLGERLFTDYFDGSFF